jgi:hypothetical protein
MEHVASGGGERMNKKILGVFASLLVVAILALPMSSAYATPPTPVTFTISVVTQGDTTPDPSGNSHVSIVNKSNWITACTGYIIGSGTMNVREVVTKGGDKTSTGLQVIDGTVDGKSGTLYIKTSVNTRDPNPSYWRIVSGTDDLANLHGQGTFVFIPGTGMVFTGQVHFDPHPAD